MAGFTGSPKMNFLAGELVRRSARQENVVKLTTGDSRAGAGGCRRGAVGDKVELGIRPEHLGAAGSCPCRQPGERRGAGG